MRRPSKRPKENAIMVVSDEKDVFILERHNLFNGLTMFCGGSIDFSKGIQASDLNIDSLFSRLNGIDEVISFIIGEQSRVS